MLTLQTVFRDKVIINGLAEKELGKFFTFLIEQIWLKARMTESMVVEMKLNKVPQISLLYKNLNVEKTVSSFLERKAFHLDKVAAVEVGLKGRINVIKKSATPYVSIELDRFMYERDDMKKNLEKILKEIIETWHKLNV